MKTLYLLRHAKSSWKKKEGADRDRPLKKKGRLQADAMSDHLASLLPPPHHVLCSPAQRTRETLEYFLELWSVPEESIAFPEPLYLAEVDALMAEIAKLPDAAEIALVVGHNPGLTDLVHHWNTSGESYTDSLRTCGFVQVDFQTDSWSEIPALSGEVKLDLRPKQLQA
jgi:phosphohistidine phosphatase